MLPFFSLLSQDRLKGFKSRLREHSDQEIHLQPCSTAEWYAANTPCDCGASRPSKDKAPIWCCTCSSVDDRAGYNLQTLEKFRAKEIYMRVLMQSSKTISPASVTLSSLTQMDGGLLRSSSFKDSLPRQNSRRHLATVDLEQLSYP